MERFQDMIGHETVIQLLQKGLQTKKIAHAYLFHGEEGMGKKAMATLFARTLQCSEAGIEPCNRCKSCMQAVSGNQPDIIWVTHEKATLGVDDIRNQLNGDIQIKPFESPYKVYIIEDGDKLTEQAQNALLKTLEEPPEYAVIFLLVSNINVILPTILSRCVVLNLRPVDKIRIKNYLMKSLQIPDDKAETATDFSGGNVGKAMEYANSEEFEQKKEDMLHILRSIDEIELSDLMAGLKKLSENKSYVNEYLDFLMLWMRDMLMLKATNDLNLLLYKNEYQFLKRQASIRTYDDIDKMLAAIEKAKIRLKANVNFDITMELMLLTIKEKSNG